MPEPEIVSTAVAVVEPADAPESLGAVVEQRRSLREHQYLAAWRACLDKSIRPTSSNLANEMKWPGKDPVKAMAKWRERHPEIDRWVEAELAREAEQYRPKILAKFARMAMIGSVPHADYLARVGGWYKQGPNGGDGGPGVTQNNAFVVHVHG